MEAANNTAYESLGEKLKTEMRAFIYSMDIEYRKQLLLAINNSFRTVINTAGKNVNYSGYIDKFTQIQEFINKAASGNYIVYLYKACDMDRNTNYMAFIASEVRNSIIADEEKLNQKEEKSDNDKAKPNKKK